MLHQVRVEARMLPHYDKREISGKELALIVFFNPAKPYYYFVLFRFTVYNDAVEEALCFGWIDSTIKSLDKEHKIQRFTPRNPKSTYSQANKERLKWLLEHKMIHLEFEDKIRTVLSVPFVFPNDIIDRLKEDERIWKNYQSFSDPYKRIRIAYIEAARKRPEEFEKRLNNFINKTKENKMIKGFGGIEKYY